MFLLLTFVMAGFKAVGAAAINWGTCPEGQLYDGILNKWDCAFLTFPLDRDDPSKGNVTSFVRRGYATTPTGKAMWGIAGGPGISTSTFIPIFDYFMSLDASLTSYLVDARGIGLSSPLASCTYEPPFWDPYNNVTMQQWYDCNEEIIAADEDRFPYVTTYYAALDLKGVMDAVNADTNSLFAASYGTYFANTFLQLPGVDIDVVVYDGPVSANRWPLENNAEMQSMQALDGIKLCIEESSVCRMHLGELGHIPKMTKDAIVDGSLPCIQKLPWLQQENGNYMTSLYNNFFNPTYNKAMLGPFWHRLYRCTDSDAEQLNHFNDVRLAEMMTQGGTPDPSYNRGYATNVGAADVYSYAGDGARSYDKVVEYNVRTFTVEGGDLTVSFARSENNWQYPQSNPISSQFAKPTAPVHIFIGTLDANTPVGQAKWVQDGMGPDVESYIYYVPYGGHGLVAPDNPCVNQIIVDLLSLKTNVDTACLDTEVPAPDWDGSDEETRNGNSLRYFGTTDLWNNGQLVDDPIDSSTASSDNCDWSSSDVNNLVAAIVVPLCIVILILAAAVLFLLMRQPISLIDKKTSRSDAL
jgi:pimeloyl-ACP methyl ester carboxylesterase